MRERTRVAVAQLLVVGVDPAARRFTSSRMFPIAQLTGSVVPHRFWRGELDDPVLAYKSMKQGWMRPEGLFTTRSDGCRHPAFQVDLLQPVGEGPAPASELTRDLAQRFNKRFGRALRVPELLIVRVRQDLRPQNPTRR